jgi:hypothetical protein
VRTGKGRKIMDEIPITKFLDFNIVRNSFKKFKLAELLHFNLTFLSWSYFVYILRKDFKSLKNGNELVLDESDVKLFLTFDREIIGQFEEVVAMKKLKFFRERANEWIEMLFHKNVEYFECVQSQETGIGLVCRKESWDDLIGIVTGYVIKIPLKVFQYLKKSQYSSTVTSPGGDGLVLYGLLSLVNHECNCSNTITLTNTGIFKLRMNKEKLDIQGQLLNDEGIIVDEVVKSRASALGQEIVFEYIFNDEMKTFECHCRLCKANKRVKTA